MTNPRKPFLGMAQCPITGIIGQVQNPPNSTQETPTPDVQISDNSGIVAASEKLSLNSPRPSISLTYEPLGLGNPTSEHVLAHLADAESREPNVWLKDDFRIAWLTVLHCAEGIADPWRYAFWKYLGAVPEKVIPILVARSIKHAAMEAASALPTDQPTPLPVPKKPSHSVPTLPANASSYRRTK